MAHFAGLDENNVVTQVIVVSNDDCSRCKWKRSRRNRSCFL
jgi:hypothetical protein